LDVTEKEQTGMKSFYKYAQYTLKLCDILQRNPGYKDFTAVKKWYRESLDLSEEILPNVMVVNRYCPVTSLDAIRSISTHKLILADKHHNLRHEYVKA
jgi:hypothetical protein